MSDARFEDATEAPLALIAQEPEDVVVVSALLQDAVLPVTEIRYERAARRLALLVNRFRWEDKSAAEARRRPYERVRSLLVISDVVAVARQGIDLTDRDTVLSLLSLSWEPGEDGTGRLILVFAGDGAIAADVECLDLTLRDVTRPYKAPSGQMPDHDH